MVKPLTMNGKIQAWEDREGVVHAIAYNREPFKQVCRKDRFGMWGYVPEFVDPSEITCEICQLDI